MMHGTGWPTHSAAISRTRRKAGISNSWNCRGERIGGAAADSKKATSSPALATARHSTAWFSASRMSILASFFGPQRGVEAQVVDAAEIEGDGERPAHGQAHVGVGKLAFQPLPHRQHHGDPPVALGIERLQIDAFFDRGQAAAGGWPGWRRAWRRPPWPRRPRPRGCRCRWPRR